jgi:hypothetical protein
LAVGLVLGEVFNLVYGEDVDLGAEAAVAAEGEFIEDGVAFGFVHPYSAVDGKKEVVVLHGDPGVVDGHAAAADEEGRRDVVGGDADPANVASCGVDEEETTKPYGGHVAVAISEVEAGMGPVDAEGEDLNGLTFDEGGLLPCEAGLCGRVKDDVKHGAEFAGGVKEIELVRRDSAGFAVELDGGTSLGVIDVLEPFY